MTTEMIMENAVNICALMLGFAVSFAAVAMTVWLGVVAYIGWKIVRSGK